MMEMFVGSSAESEALAKKISRRIKREIPGILPKHWRETFKSGHYTLPSLIHDAERYHLALLIFSPDDVVSSREEQTPAPRDNILLEAGLFLSRLGLRRVALVVEDTVKFPTDFDGLVHVRFSASWTDEKIVNEVAKQVKDSWTALRDPAPLGVERTLRQMETDSAAQAEGLYFPGLDSDRRVIIDSRPCTEVYLDGLHAVSNRFWTTSFLTSGFWTGTDVDNILRANSHMLRKLSGRRDGSARRVFLLPQDREQYLLAEKAEVEKRRQASDGPGVREMKSNITSLRKHVQRMTLDGFETRVVHDASRAWDRLINILDVRHKPNDTEIAIYDNFRIDLYSGGAKGVIHRVICLNEGTRNFRTKLSAAEEYFEHLWETGEDGLKFVQLCEDAIYRAAKEIDYTPNWLALYDYRLSASDEHMKAEELSITADLIAKHFGGFKLSRYLDIGSCTGRYPLQLLKLRLFDESPTIIALENDRDAYRLMSAKREMPEFVKEGVHVTPQRGDFMLRDSVNYPSSFQLITCMLGTISHLAAPGPDGKSSLLLAIQKMTACLAPDDGVLILGCWSEEAIRHKDFLEIYTSHDKTLLAAWSPTPAEMIAAIGQCGLRYTMSHVGARIDLYFCVRKGTAKSS